MEALLEPVRGLGAKPEFPRGLEDSRAIPGRDFEEDGGGPGRDLGRCPTHDSGYCRRAVAVADDHGSLGQFPFYPVEGLDLLPLDRGPDHELATGNPVEIEGMERLARKQHHVVGYVDHVVDRPLSC